MSAFGDRVAAAIARTGWFDVTVLPGPNPGWRYTIGLTEAGLPEVLVAGTAACVNATLDEARRALAVGLVEGDVTIDARGVLVGGVEFDVRPVHPSWTERLLNQAVRFYPERTVTAVQAVPTAGWADVPDASVEYNPSVERPWRWLDEGWAYPCDDMTLVFADVDVLRGRPVVQVIREGESDGSASWTMRIADEHIVDEDSCRLVPMGTLLALDPSLAGALDLEPGEWATYDDEARDWRVWGD